MKTATIVRAGSLGVLLISAGCVTAGSGRLLSTVVPTVIPPPDVETLEVQGTLALPEGAEIAGPAGEPDCTPAVLAVVMTVPAAQRHRLRVDQWLELTTDTVPGIGFLGRIKYISPAADPGTRWVRVVAHVSNEDGYLDVGLPVRGHVRMSRQVTSSQP